MERQTGRYRITSTLGEQARTPPPTRKAIELLNSLGVLREITGNRRRQAYVYHEYLEILTGDDA